MKLGTSLTRGGGGGDGESTYGRRELEAALDELPAAARHHRHLHRVAERHCRRRRRERGGGERGAANPNPNKSTREAALNQICFILVASKCGKLSPLPATCNDDVPSISSVTSLAIHPVPPTPCLCRSCRPPPPLAGARGYECRRVVGPLGVGHPIFAALSLINEASSTKESWAKCRPI